MLATQFEHLNLEEQRILQSGSVTGERFSIWAVASMLDGPPAMVEETCDKLARQQQFIRSTGIRAAAGGKICAQYEFRHSLYRQALYRSLSGAHRSKLHRSLGEWLASACTNGRPELAAEVAMHCEEAGDYEQAARFLMLAGENAVKRFAHGDSITVLGHALELAAGLAAPERTVLEVEILQRIGDARYVLGAMSDSVLFYETAATRAADAGLRPAQIDALARLAFPVWGFDPERGNRICEQAIEVSKAHGDPLLLAQTELAAACFRLMYDVWRKEDAETCASAQQTIRRLGGAAMTEHVYYVCVRAIQGYYVEALKQAEAVMVATASPAAYLLAFGAKALSLIGLGRFGEVLQIVKTGRELAEKNGEEPWLFIFRETWLRSLCFDFEGVLRLSQIIMSSDAEQHARQPRTMAMVAAGYAELYQGRWKEALHYFAQVRDPQKTPAFFLHWRWRMRSHLGSIDALLLGGDIENARREADGFLQSAFSTGEPNLHAFAWEARARVAVADKDCVRALKCVESALAVLDEFDIPVVGWRVHATAWDVCRYAGKNERAEEHRTRAREVIMRLADSFEPEEPLRASLMAAAPVQRIFAHGMSA
jgi:tetratricopeptide (TPR) repeat protein